MVNWQCASGSRVTIQIRSHLRERRKWKEHGHKLDDGSIRLVNGTDIFKDEGLGFVFQHTSYTSLHRSITFQKPFAALDIIRHTSTPRGKDTAHPCQVFSAARVPGPKSLQRLPIHRPIGTAPQVTVFHARCLSCKMQQSSLTRSQEICARTIFFYSPSQRQ